MRHFVVMMVVATLAVTATSLHAEDDAREESAMPPIRVTAPRLEQSVLDAPAAVSVVSGPDVARQRQDLSLAEPLARIPGMFLQNRHNFAQDLRISIRGFGARAPFGVRGVKLLVDGIPQTLPDGQAQVDGIDLDTVARMEVIRGPASALYGNASGGVIRIETRDGPPEPFVSTEIQGGSYGFFETDVQAGGQGDVLNYFANASVMSLTGYRDHSRTENANLNLKLRGELGPGTSLTGLVNLVDSPKANDPGGLTAAQVAQDREQAHPRNLRFDAGEQLEQQQGGLVLETALSDSEAVTGRVYYTRRDFANKLPFTDGGQVVFERDFFGAGIEYTASGTLAGRANRFVLGMDADRQRDDRRRFDNNDGQRGALTLDQLETVDSVGVFLQDELRLAKRWRLTAGARYDEVRFEVEDRFLADGDDSGSRTLSEPSGLLGLSWAVRPRHRLYANVATAFETPTTTELARPGGGGFNPDVDPQTATNYEIGAKGAGESLRYQLALFHIDVRDEIVPREDSLGREFFENAGESTRDGLELSAEYRLSSSLSLTGAYTWSDFTFDRFVDADGNVFDGNRIPGIPEHQLFGAMTWRWAGHFAALELRAVDDFWANNANTAENPGYAVVDVRAGRKLFAGGFTIEPYVGVNNLLDKEYNGNVRINAFGGRYFEPAPEINVHIGVEITG